MKKANAYWPDLVNETNESKFEGWMDQLAHSHDGTMDVEALFEGEYGRKLAEISKLRFLYEEEPMGEACLSYYESIGVTKRMYEEKDFFARWAVFYPSNINTNDAARKKYPVIFWNHGGGNAIEIDEFSTPFSEMVAKENYILVMLQNTNWEHTDEVLNQLIENYPVDQERIYAAGYSQGGQATQSTLLRIPKRLAAVAPCGTDSFNCWDNLDVRYTMEELERLRAIFTPVIQISGQCEFLNFVPLNSYRPVQLMKGGLMGKGMYHDVRNIVDQDMTNPPGKRSGRQIPPEDADGSTWKVERLNTRLYTLGCTLRNVEQCISYQNEPDTELHRIVGTYGDQEEIRKIYGQKHYIVDFKNRDSVLAYRYITVENFTHWPPITMAELIWDFFRQYRRDAKTGKIVVDPLK